MREPMRLAGVMDKVRPMLPILASHFGIEIVGIGGSVARGENRLDSDIDFGVRKTRSISLFEVIDAKDMLEDALLAPVDLVFLDALPSYKYSIFVRDLVAL